VFSRFKDGQLPLSRIEAFSDGVFAIIVTLLVLDLKVPALHQPSSVHELLEGLRLQLPKFLSWMISFIIVCKFWLNHHYIFGQARYANYGMVWLNAIFLMFQSFIPFPTAMMGEYSNNALAVSTFGVVMALNTVFFLTLQLYIYRNLLKPELEVNRDTRIVQKAIVGPLFYILGSTAAWFYTPAAFVFYMITPLFFITPPSPVKTRS
jgi:uncharacterized membrane protein